MVNLTNSEFLNNPFISLGKVNYVKLNENIIHNISIANRS